MYTVDRWLSWTINWDFCYKKCSFQSHGLIEQPSYTGLGIIKNHVSLVSLLEQWPFRVKYRQTNEKSHRKPHEYDLDSNCNISRHMFHNVVPYIVLSLALYHKQRTEFGRLKMIVHISGGFPLFSADSYDVTSRAKLTTIIECRL